MVGAHRFVLFGAGDWAEWADPLFVELGAQGGHAAVVAAGQTENGSDAIGFYRRGAESRLGRVGIATVHVPLLGPGDGEGADAVRALDGAALVYVLGGGPRSTVSALRGSVFWQTLLSQKVPFAGSSGGAMLVGSRYPSDLSFTAVDAGLGTNPRLVIATHWDELDDMRPGLRESFIREVGDDTLIAIDRDTAIDGDGTHWRVVGCGSVLVRSGATALSYSAGDEFRSPESLAL